MLFLSFVFIFFVSLPFHYISFLSVHQFGKGGRAWARLPKDVTQGKAFDYYPRGRVELRQGRAYLFLSPLLCREEVVLQVKDAFGLDQLPVLLKADGSRHYRCYLDE